MAADFVVKNLAEAAPERVQREIGSMGWERELDGIGKVARVGCMLDHVRAEMGVSVGGLVGFSCGV